MRLARFSFVICSLAAAALACAEPQKMTYNVLGSKIGENVYELKADGSFTSTTKIEISTTKIESTLTGRFVDKKLTTFSLKQTMPGVDMTITSDGKDILATVNGKPQKATYKYKGEAFFAGYHPWISGTMSSALDPKTPGPQKIDTFVFDNGVNVPLTVRPQSPRTVQVNGKGQTIRSFVAAVGPVEIEFLVDESGKVLGQSVPAQKLTVFLSGYDAIFTDPVAKYTELSQPTFQPHTERGIKVKMRDGIELVHDMARPAAEGKYPTILMRTPYGRTLQSLGSDWWAKRGYVVITQDCRGRDDSGGEWDPMVNERKDGYDTIEWIAKQPWSDGNVGMIGASYGGYVQWCAAVEHPAALKCIVPQVSPPDAFMNVPYDHGCFALMPDLWWTNIVKDRTAAMENASKPLPHPEKLDTLPLSKADDAVLGVNVPFFDKWLERDDMTKWQGFDFTKDIATVTIPALHISGWWDGDGIGTKLNWAAMRAAGRKNQWLIDGPWPHAFNTSSKFADQDYGPESVLELDSLYLRWFDTWLKGKDVGIDKVPHVRVFVTGANKWLDLTDWPQSDSPEKSLYLSDNGQLLDHPKAGAKPGTYTYNPAALSVPKEAAKAVTEGSTTVVEMPKDPKGLLVYRSSPLADAVSIGGPISVDLSFSVDVKDTDFFASIFDIDPKGVARVIGQPGKIDLKYRNGNERPELLEPGKIYTVHIDLWDTAHHFAKGHQIGIYIRSELFPAYARNLNTGEPIKEATRSVPAHITIYHTAANPSVLKFRVLPVK